MAATVVVTVLPDQQMGSKPSPYPSTTQQHPNHHQDPYQSANFNSTETRRHSSSSSYQPPPSPIQGYPDGGGGGGREGGGGAPSSSFYSSSHPPDLRGRLPSSSSSHHVPSSRSPSPSALSPQLTFETTEPQHYHGQTSFGYDFLPAVQPQIFSAPSAHPFAFASTSTSSTTDQQHPNNHNEHSPSHPQHPSYPASSSSSQVQQYTLSHSSQLGSSSRMSGEESDERKRRGRMSAQQEEEGFRRGEMLAERRNVMEQERGFTRSDGWEGRKEDRRGGMEEVDWNGSGAEDDDDDDDRDGSGLGRRDSGTGSRGEIKTRRRTSRAQFQALETMFQKTSKPTQTDRKNLGEQLDMSPRAVQVWFQNRRAKAKKQRQKAAFDGAGPPPPPPPPQPPLAFSENPYPGAPPNSRIHHSVPYDSMGRRASAGAGPSRRSHSDEDRMGSSSSHSFSPEAISPPFVPPHNNGAPLGGWETVPSLRRNGSVNVNGQMPPPSFPPPQPQPQSNGQHPSSNGNGGSSQHLGRPNDPSGRRTNSTSPVYDDRSPQSNWNPGGGQFESRGPGFLQQSPRRGSGIPGAGEPRMGRRSSTTPADGGGVGPDRTVKRRDSNGALVLDPLSMGGRRGSIPQNIHSHQQHHSSSPSRQAIRPVVPSNGSSMEVPISHSFRGGGGGQGNRQPGSTVAQYLSSSAAARRSSLPSMGPMPQGGPMRSPGGMYAPPIHGGGGGSRRELSPIQDDGAVYASQSFGSMGPGAVEQGMFDPSYGNSGFYGGPPPGGGRGGPAAVDPNPPRRQPHPFYGNGPIPEPSFEPQPPSQPRSRNDSYHHLHQQHQPYDEIDPLTIQPPAPPLPQLSQYAFPGPPNSGLSSAPPQSNLLSRRNSGQALPQQPLFTSSPHESYAFPPAPIGTLPDQGFSFGTYQQGSGGGGVYAESDAGGTTERDEMGLGMGRNGSTGGDSDGSWANGFGGGGGGFGAGQDGTGHYPGDNGGLMPHGFHPDVRRSSAPADLLQNFSSLQVLGAANGLPPSAFPRPSPLNPAFAGVPSNGGGGTSPSRNGVQPLYAIHESSHSGSGSGQGSRGSGQGPQQMGMPEGFVQQQQQHGGQQVDWAANQGLQGMDSNYPYPQSSHHQSYSSSSGGTNTTASQSRPSTGNQPQPHLSSSSSQDPFHAFDPLNSTSSSQRHLSNPNLVFELEGPGYDDEGAAKPGGGFGFAYR